MVLAKENSNHDPYEHKEKSESLLSQYKLPISHLDFSYVEKCTDGRELEKIVHVLQSGQEGYYPDLTKAAVEKLKILRPKSKFLRNLSRVIEKEDMGQEEWNEISKDLNDWVSSISKDNRELEMRKGGKTAKNLAAPEIRQINTISEEQEIKNEKRIKSTDYASWDKYDPDTELLKMELEEEKLKKEASENLPKKKPKKHVKFNSFATEAEANYEAKREREKGNEYFRTGEYNSALNHYTVSLECRKTIECLNNRAATFIKLEKYEKAIDDCDDALAIDRDNLKANFRKAQALEKLKKFKEGLECIEKCIRIQPNNTAAQELASRIRENCGIRLEKTRFAIEDVQGEKKMKEVVKQSKQGKLEKKRNSQLKLKNSRILVPIPGTSKMAAPYYVTCKFEDVEKTIYQINNRTQILGFITAQPEDDEECSIDHLEHICTKDRIEVRSNLNNDKSILNSVNVNVQNNDIKIEQRSENFCTEKETLVRTTQKKPNKTILNRIKDIRLTDKDAGGEPYKRDNVITIPRDISSPFTFLKTWTSLGEDPTFKKHAHIIKHMNMDQLVQVIGCKLDNDMLSTALKTLCMHFAVPGELEKLYSVLVNIARLPRFPIIAMLMSQQDRNCLNFLISFLQQHDKCLPDEVREAFNC